MKVKLHRLGWTSELEEFVKRMNLSEPFDYTASFIFTGKIDGELAFVNVFRLESVGDKVIPRFIHILLDKPVRRSKLAIDLMKQSEEYLKILGYTQVFAYISNEDRLMSTLAMKFGYVKNKEDKRSTYYFKNLTKEK